MTKEQKQLRMCASAVLNRRDNRLSLVLAALGALLASVIVFYIAEGALPMILDGLSEVVEIPWSPSFPFPEILFFCMFLLFAMPLWLGMYRMAVRMVRGEESAWHEVFHFASCPGLWLRSIGIGCRLMLAWLPCLAVLTLAVYAPDAETQGVCGAVAILMLVFGFVLVNGMAGVTALMVGDDRMCRRQARYTAAKRLSGKQMRLLGRSFKQAFFNILAIVCTVGLLFLLHTLPMTMLTNACRMSGEVQS